MPHIRSDSETKELVVRALMEDRGLDSARVGVGVDGGTVMLSGQLRTRAERLLAQQAALRVAGVNAIDDTMTVDSVPPLHNDADIAAAASRILAQRTSTDRLHAVVRDRVVTLTGRAGGDIEHDAVDRDIRAIDGVTAVADLVRVSTSVPDAEVRFNVYAALGDTRHPERGIQVHCDHGAVRLEGVVHSWQESSEAVTAAWRGHGVTSVESKLSILDGG